MKFSEFIYLILAALMLLTGCSSSADYVVDIGGDKISRGEFMIYLKEQKKSFEQQGGSDIWDADFDGVSAIEVAKQNAVNSIVMVKSAVKEANSLGIELDSADIEAAESEADSIMAEFSSDELSELGINKSKIIDVLKESKLQSKVFSYITDSYVVNEDEFASYYADYKQEHSEEFNTYYIRELFLQRDESGKTDNYNKVQKAVSEISSGTDFEAAAKAAAPTGNYEVKELDSSLYGEEALAAIYAMKAGEVKLVEDTAGYYVIEMSEIKPKDEGEVKANIKESYITERKQEIYQEQSESWTGSVEVKRNDEAWNSIKII